MEEVKFQPFDKVLVRDNSCSWKCSFFSHINTENSLFPYVVINGGFYQYCIAYNDETKHLINTMDNPPESEPEFKFGDKVEVRWYGNHPWKKAIFSRINPRSDDAKFLCFVDNNFCETPFHQCRHADW